MRFHRYHGLGNDYLVMDPAASRPRAHAPRDPAHLPSQLRRRLGRHPVGPAAGARAPTSGCASSTPTPARPRRAATACASSRATSSTRGWCGASRSPSRPRAAWSGPRSTPAAGRWTWRWAQVSFDGARIPVAGGAREVLNEQLTVGGRTFTFSAATIGNPHCVLPLPEISEALARQYGPLIEVEPRFPNRTNVQFLKVLDRGNIRIEIWERGAGYTLASGQLAAAPRPRWPTGSGWSTATSPSTCRAASSRSASARASPIDMTGPVTRDRRGHRRSGDVRGAPRGSPEDGQDQPELRQARRRGTCSRRSRGAPGPSPRSTPGWSSRGSASATPPCRSRPRWWPGCAPGPRGWARPRPTPATATTRASSWMREAIAGVYRERGVDLELWRDLRLRRRQVATRATSSRSSRADAVVAVQDPAYPVYVDTNVMAGRTGAYDPARGQYQGIVYMPCTEQNGFFPELPGQEGGPRLPLQPQQPDRRGGHPRPAGSVFVEYARAHEAVILFDAAYSAFIRDPALPHSIYEVPGAKSCAIEINSFSKSAGFTGVRLGWAVVPKDAGGRGLPARQAQRHVVPAAEHLLQRPFQRGPGRRRRRALAARGARSAGPWWTSISPTRASSARASHGRARPASAGPTHLTSGRGRRAACPPGTSSTCSCARRTWSPRPAPGFGPERRGLHPALGLRAARRHRAGGGRDPGRAGESVAMSIAPFGRVTARSIVRGRRAGRHALLPLRRGDDRPALPGRARHAERLRHERALRHEGQPHPRHPGAGGRAGHGRRRQLAQRGAAGAAGRAWRPSGSCSPARRSPRGRTGATSRRSCWRASSTTPARSGSSRRSRRFAPGPAALASRCGSTRAWGPARA